MGLETEGVHLSGPGNLEAAVPTWGFTARCSLGVSPVASDLPEGSGGRYFLQFVCPQGVSFKICFEEAKMTQTSRAHHE